MHVRALAYILAHGGPGLRNVTMDAVLNATYIRKLLEPYYDLRSTADMHDACSAMTGGQNAAYAPRHRQRLIDYGFHPYTVSFPLIVREHDD